MNILEYWKVMKPKVCDLCGKEKEIKNIVDVLPKNVYFIGGNLAKPISWTCVFCFDGIKNILVTYPGEWSWYSRNNISIELHIDISHFS